MSEHDVIGHADSDSLRLDRKMRLDHILTWLVSGIFVGLTTALLWVHSVDKRVAAIEQEQRYQRERDMQQDNAHTAAALALKEQVREMNGKLDQLYQALMFGKRPKEAP